MCDDVADVGNIARLLHADDNGRSHDARTSARLW
jgi:hypothetical protein